MSQKAPSFLQLCWVVTILFPYTLSTWEPWAAQPPAMQAVRGQWSVLEASTGHGSAGGTEVLQGGL